MGFSSGLYGSFHEGNGYEWVEYHSARYTSSSSDSSSSSGEMTHARCEKEETLAAKWAAIGQYAKCGNFVFPIDIQWMYIAKHYPDGIDDFTFEDDKETVFYSAQVRFTDEYIFFYRLIDADPAATWLMAEEFRAQTGFRTRENTRIRPWW